VQAEISAGQGVAARRNGVLPRRTDRHVKTHEGRAKAVLPIPMGVIFPRLLTRWTSLSSCFGRAALGAGVLEPHEAWAGPGAGQRIGRNRIRRLMCERWQVQLECKRGQMSRRAGAYHAAWNRAGLGKASPAAHDVDSRPFPLAVDRGWAEAWFHGASRHGNVSGRHPWCRFSA
jgi:hypothetical protein